MFIPEFRRIELEVRIDDILVSENLIVIYVKHAVSRNDAYGVFNPESPQPVDRFERTDCLTTHHVANQLPRI